MQKYWKGLNGGEMETMIFKAFSISNEIDLNKIAVACNIRKKYTWEEPLILQKELLIAFLKVGLSASVGPHHLACTYLNRYSSTYQPKAVTYCCTKYILRYS